jgi:hypothetical protein
MCSLRTFREFLGMLLLGAATGATAHAQSNASGTLTIGKDRFEIRYAAATQVPDPFEKTKMNTRIVLTDKPVPEDLLDDDGQIIDLKRQGCHGLRVDITQDKTTHSTLVISASLQGSLSNSGTFNGKQLTVFTSDRVEGLLEAAPEEVTGTVLGFSIKFSAEVMPPEAPPTSADEAAASGKEPAKAYLALVEAIRSGDKQKIIDLSPPDRRGMIDTPEFPEMLKMVQQMTHQNIQVLKVSEHGDRARLLARGSLEGQTQRGKIYLNRLKGRWVMAGETWGTE